MFALLEKGMEEIIDPAREKAVDQAEDSRHKSFLAEIVVFVISILVLALVNYFLIRGIVNPLRQGVALADAIRDGDLSKRLELKSKDEIARLAQALDVMADSLENKADLAHTIARRDLTARVVLSSEKDRLGLALTEMVDGSESDPGPDRVRGLPSSCRVRPGVGVEPDVVSRSDRTGRGHRTDHRFDVRTEIPGLNPMRENASQANQLSGQAREAAVKGNRQMQDMVAAMNEIAGSSKEIAKVIKAIDDIAFQTNLFGLECGRSRPPGPVNTARDLPWWPRKSATSPPTAPGRPASQPR